MAPIVQTFEADFTQYQTAVQQADAQLKSFSTDSDKIAAQLGRMTDSFSGQKVIQQATLMQEAIERVGGTANLTEDELARFGTTATAALEKLELLGMEAPAGLEAMAAEAKAATAEMETMGDIVGELQGKLVALFGVEQVYEYVKGLVEMGAQIEKMSEQTGMSVEQVQSLSFVAGQADTSVESLISGVQTLTQRLGSGDNAGLAKAFKDLNIDVAAFQTKDAYDQLKTLSDALRDLPTQAQFAQDAFLLFGKNWKEIAAALKLNFDEVDQGAAKLSKDQVAYLDDMEKGAKAWWANTKTYAAEVLISLEQAADSYEKLPPRVAGLTEATRDAVAAADAMATAWSLAATAADQAVDKFDDAYDKATQKFEKDNDAFFAKVAADHKKAVDELKKTADAATNAAESYEKAIDAIRQKFSGETAVADAQKYVQAFGEIGAAVDQLTNKELDEFETKMQAGIEGLAREGQLTSDVANQFSALIVQIEQLKHAHDDNAAATAAAEAADRAFTQAQYDAAVAADKAAQSLQEETDKAKALAQAQADADAAAKARVSYSMASKYSTGDLQAQAAQTGGQVVLDSYGNPYVWIPGVNAPPPGRAAGGPVSSNSVYLVGEQGPELFVPNTAGTIVPNGSGTGGAGGTVVNNTFHLVDTASNLARQVADLIGRSVTQARRVA